MRVLNLSLVMMGAILVAGGGVLLVRWVVLLME